MVRVLINGDMAGPSYPAARIVAQRLEARIATSTAAFKNASDAPKPDAGTIEEIITTAFWASLRREEGHVPRISIAFLPPEQSVRPVQFNPRIRLEANLCLRAVSRLHRLQERFLQQSDRAIITEFIVRAERPDRGKVHRVLS